MTNSTAGNTTDSYTTIRTSTLRGDQKIGFNAYIKLNEKMILYLRNGDSFEGDRLKRLIEKKLRKMYIQVNEEPKYRDYLRVNIESAYDNKTNKSIETRAEIIEGAQESNIEEVFENPEDEAKYNQAKMDAQKYVQFIMENDKAIQSVLSIENSDQSISHHGVSVATLSVALARKLKIEDPKRIQLLTLGAFLHDIGHRDLKFDLKKKPKSMSKAEMDTFMSHTVVGAKVAAEKKHFDQSVINIIAQHEEIMDGSGPLGLKESAQDPMVPIVSVCNQLDRLISFEGVPRDESVKRLVLERMGMHQLTHMQMLADIIKSFKN